MFFSFCLKPTWSLFGKDKTPWSRSICFFKEPLRFTKTANCAIPLDGGEIWLGSLEYIVPPCFQLSLQTQSIAYWVLAMCVLARLLNSTLNFRGTNWGHTYAPIIGLPQDWEVGNPRGIKHFQVFKILFFPHLGVHCVKFWPWGPYTAQISTEKFCLQFHLVFQDGGQVKFLTLRLCINFIRGSCLSWFPMGNPHPGVNHW